MPSQAPTLQAQLQKLVDDFVAEVALLAQRAATEALANAFTKAQLLDAQAAAGRLQTKRSRAQLADTTERLAAYVTENPGLRMEEINRALGTRTRDLQLPIKKLLAEGRLAAKGTRRVTRYYPSRRK